MLKQKTEENVFASSIFVPFVPFRGQFKFYDSCR